jgi:hypothetical protein
VGTAPTPELSTVAEISLACGPHDGSGGERKVSGPQCDGGEQ